EHVQIAELLDRLADETFRPVPVGDVLAVDDRFAAHRLDVLDGLLRRAQVAALAAHVATEVVHDDLRPFARKQQRVLAAQAAAGTGDDRDASVECTHRCLPRVDGRSDGMLRGRTRMAQCPRPPRLNVRSIVVVSSGTFLPGSGLWSVTTASGGMWPL